MDSQDFYNGIKTLYDWFNKQLTDTQEDIIYHTIKFIPDKAWNDIVERYTKKFKPMPSQFPTPEDIVSQWYVWRKENPEFIQKSFEPTECDECYGKGLVWYKYLYEPLQMVYEGSVRCSQCDNWKQHFNHHCKIPFKTREQLKQDPLVREIWPYENSV